MLSERCSWKGNQLATGFGESSFCFASCSSSLTWPSFGQCFQKQSPGFFDLKSVGFFGKFLGGTSHDLAIFQLRRAAILQEGSWERGIHPNKFCRKKTRTWTKFSCFFGGGVLRKNCLFSWLQLDFRLKLSSATLPANDYTLGCPPSVNHRHETCLGRESELQNL